MPLSRYLLRNEFCLADPELYRAADKNDPEALLEGVAMAGLVGVLRQLGDLAEFAAEIFNDLHEEVMATASRGHGLKIRVQQLEAEFPSIEKAFLSQTNQSLFLYNEGIDWHPNLRIDQNLIARGDLPRSVMDSYEECRGPPRLFLLDKFDIGGVGACLKRYSDPSFFKAELTSSASTKAESQREKKARKIRRKGSQWKIRDTPEGFAKSHAKLHQLFSEERIQTDINVPINHVKLKKRQLNRFRFDSTSGRSYMERFLETRSPEHVLGTQSSVDQLVMRDRYLVPRPSRHEKILEICMEDLAEDVIEEASFEKLPVPTSDIELEKVPSNFYKVEGKKEEMVVGESKTEGSADGYRSDDVISEMENYMDALTTMESELETDTECRPKNERGYFHIERKRMDSNRSEELQELQGRFSDSHSIGNSSASDDGTHSFKKGRSSFSYSNSPSSSAENVLSDGDVALKLDPSTESSSVEFVDVSSAKLCENRDALGTRSSEHLVSSDTYNEVSELPSYRSGFGEVPHDSSLTNSTFTLHHISEKESTSKEELVGSDSTETSSSCTKEGSFGLSVNSEEDSNNTSGDLPCRIDVSDFPSQTRDDLVPVASAKGQPEGLLDGRIPNESSDTLLHLPNFSDLDFEKKDSDDAFEEMLPKDNCIKGNLINATLESSHSVSLPTEEQLQGLAEQDLETGSSSTSLPECLPCSPNDNSELDDVEPGEKKATTLTGENSDYLTSVEGDLETGDFVELNFPEMTNEVPLFELDSKKVGITHSEVERLCNNVEVSSDFTTSPTLNRASETEVHLQLNSITGRIHEEVDDIHTVVDCNQVSLLSEDQINLQEECHSPGKDLLQEKHLSRNRGMDQFIVEIPNPSSSDNLTGVDAQKAAMNQAPVSPSELKIMLPNPESYDPSGSKLLSCVHNEMLVEDESHLHLSDCTRVATSLGEGDQESELRKPQSDLLGNAEDATSPSTHSPLELGTTFTEAMESLAEQHNGEKTPLADEEGPKLFNHESEQLQIPSNIYRDVCFDSSQHLSQLPGSQFSQVLASHKVESSEPSTSSISFFPSFDTLHGATHQQLLEPQTIRPVLDLPLPAAEAVEANVMEIPPLPPLPPIEWRIGKLQPRSLASGREVVQSSLNPFSPVTADEPAQWCFPELGRELEQPLNPFLDMNNDKVLDGFGVGREMVQSSLNPFLSPVPMEGDEKIKQDFLALEKNVAQPLNPFLSPVTVNEKSPHCSLDSGVRLVQPDSDEFSPLPSNEDVNAQHPSLNLDGEVVQPLNLFSLIQDREDENSRDTIKFAPSPRTEDVNAQHPSLDLDGEVVQPMNSLSLIQDREDENSQDAIKFAPSPSNEDVSAQHSSLNLEGEVVQPLNSLPQGREDENSQDTIKFAPSPSNEDVSALHSSLNLEGKVVQPLNSLPQDKEDEKPQDASVTSEEEKVQLPYLFKPPPTMEDEEPLWTLENEKLQHVSLSFEEEMTWQPNLYVIPPMEEEIPNRSRKAWLRRPRDPLIEAVASHDKSTLRKVTERVQPQIGPKVDERDSLLQQIRAKSFNLKPTVGTRPSTQAPKSNLRVAAILEKANAIRQALAGSDEDDDSESWSDS